MAISEKAVLIKDWLGVRIPQWWSTIAGSFVEVSDKNPFPIQISNSDGIATDVQHPLPTDGDSVYVKDIKDTLSDVGTFTGVDLKTLFNNLDDTITDSSATNPKWFKIFLERPITTGSIGVVANTGDFSNVHIEFMDRQENLLAENDDRNNNTKYTAKGYSLTAVNVCCVKVSFYTTDDITVSFLRITKDTTTTARLKALKPDGRETEISATAGGNLKVSVEEFDEALTSVNDDRTTNLDGVAGLNTNAMMFGRVSDTVVKGVRVDASTESQITISYEHHELHSGTHFTFCKYSDVGLDGTLEIVVTTPDTTKWGHWTFVIDVTQTTVIDIYEGSTNIVGETSITPINNNRNHINTSTATIISGPTSITAGTLLPLSKKLGANKTGGFDSRDREIILKQGMSYLLRATSKAASNTINFCANFYEHTDRNSS